MPNYEAIFHCPRISEQNNSRRWFMCPLCGCINDLSFSHTLKPSYKIAAAQTASPQSPHSHPSSSRAAQIVTSSRIIDAVSARQAAIFSVKVEIVFRHGWCPFCVMDHDRAFTFCMGTSTASASAMIFRPPHTTVSSAAYSPSDARTRTSCISTVYCPASPRPVSGSA